MDYQDWTATAGALGDRYVLRERIGSGQTTTVYTADDVRLEREVAVKVFHGLPGDDGYDRFAAEAQVLGGLSHAGLVTVFDVCLDTDRPWLVMRLVEGGTLGDLIDGEGFEPPAVARLGAQLSDALAYIHERGVVHGDIHADNVLIDEKGRANLTGFGTDGGLDMSADVYALGALLDQCLPPDLGPEWQVVLSSLTDPDPDARPDAIRCGELLRNIADGQTGGIPLPRVEEGVEHVADAERKPRKKTGSYGRPAPPDKARAKDRPPPERRITPAYAGLTGLGLAVVALAVVLITVPSGQPGPSSDGQQENPRVEQPAGGGDLPQPPGQTYPAPAREQGPVSTPPGRDHAKRPRSSTTSPTSPSSGYDQGDGYGDDGYDHDNGNDNDGHQDNGNHRGHGGLLGGILIDGVL
jgi:protein kinase-like protein